jgi:hypothetical protein
MLMLKLATKYPQNAKINISYRQSYISHPLTDIIKLMAGTKRNKSHEVSREGFITVYPLLHESKEKGKLRLILKRLIQLRKGH